MPVNILPLNISNLFFKFQNICIRRQSDEQRRFLLLCNFCINNQLGKWSVKSHRILPLCSMLQSNIESGDKKYDQLQWQQFHWFVLAWLLFVANFVIKGYQYNCWWFGVHKISLNQWSGAWGLQNLVLGALVLSILQDPEYFVGTSFQSNAI